MSDTKEAKRRKAFLLADEIGLTDDERHDLAAVILRRDITTWKGLEEEQYERLLDAMEGFEKIVSLLSQRAP